MVFIPLFLGCQVLALGGAGVVGAYAWINGNLTRNYAQPLETAWEGTMHAVRTLRLNVVKQKRDAFNGLIDIELVKGDPMRISLERWTDRETRITVRVGLGDREVSIRVHEEIARSLK